MTLKALEQPAIIPNDQTRLQFEYSLVSYQPIQARTASNKR
jgi:hypothetical protein